MVLTETERKILKHFRYPLHSFPIDELKDEDLVSLYNKMDEVIEEEGKTRRSFGSMDEMYVIELLIVKEALLKEIHKREGKRSQ